jgi:hypothetical protein
VLAQELGLRVTLFNHGRGSGGDPRHAPPAEPGEVVVLQVPCILPN